MKNWGITAVSIAVVAILGYLAYTGSSINDLVYKAKNTASLVRSATSTPSIEEKFTISAVSSKTDPKDVVVGYVYFKFAEFTFDAKKAGQDINVLSMKLKLDKSKNGDVRDLSDCQMFEGTTSVTPPIYATSTNLFDFGNGFLVSKGTSRTVALKCNVSSLPYSPKGTTFSFAIKNAADVLAKGMTYNSNIKVNLSSAKGPTITLRSSGELKVSLASSQKTKKVACGQSNVEIAKFKISSSYESTQLMYLRLRLSGTATSSALTKFNLYDENNSLIGFGSFETWMYGIATTTISMSPINENGSKTITVTGDIAQYPCQSGKTLGIDYDGYFDATGLISGKKIPVFNSAKISAPKITLTK